MNSVIILLTILIALLLCSLLILIFFTMKLVKNQTESRKESEKAQLALLDKMTGLLSAKDPLAFQQIQATTPSTDSETVTDEGEDFDTIYSSYMQQYGLNGNYDVSEDELNERERSVLSD
jgi:flagellar basal body-associated protein FliL